MISSILRTVVRTRFKLTSRDKASRQIREALDSYLALAESLDAENGARPITVPALRGVDEDMRNWSFFMILEHNAIVNRALTAVIKDLVLGGDPGNTRDFDHKKDVMPSPKAGPEQAANFRASVEEHFDAISGLDLPRGGATRPHPIFGDLDAHGWQCMFGLHLGFHLRQAEHVLQGLRADHWVTGLPGNS